MFAPEAARLYRFFELSALMLALAPRGGFQSKAGPLKVIGANAGKRGNQPGLTPWSWIKSREPKWVIVRDTYIVVTDGPESVSRQWLLVVRFKVCSDPCPPARPRYSRSS